MYTSLSKLMRFHTPFHPDIVPIAGSVYSALIWQQIENWSLSHPHGFYKFLNKPKQFHSKYRAGDSWVEEMHFTEKEFRTAFDKIGVRHASKKAYHSSDNKFMRNGKELFFCSYYDKIHHMTYYFRNGDLIDKTLAELRTHLEPNRVKPLKVDDLPLGQFSNPANGSLPNGNQAVPTMIYRRYFKK